MGQGCAVQSCPDRNTHLSQPGSKVLAVRFRNKRNRSTLMFPREYPQSKITQTCGAVPGFPLLTKTNTLDACLLQILESSFQPCNARNIHSTRFQPVRQKIRHFLTNGSTSCTAEQQRLCIRTA